ncbi:MAG: hypothetical protein KBA51_01580 [Kiritimatiellae bacterium]|nr:hypothetical protein [Kiritimatiellia bacterium]
MRMISGALIRDWLRREPWVVQWIPARWKWIPLLCLSVAVPVLLVVPWMSEAMGAMVNAKWERVNAARLEQFMTAIFVSGSLFLGGGAQYLNRGRPLQAGVWSALAGAAAFSLYTSFLPIQYGFWIVLTALGVAAAITSSCAVHRIRRPGPSAPRHVLEIRHLLILAASMLFFVLIE